MSLVWEYSIFFCSLSSAASVSLGGRRCVAEPWRAADCSGRSSRGGRWRGVMAFGGSGALPKRILKETERLLSDPVPGINAVPHDDNARYFSVVILGPQDSPYAGGTFRLELFLPDDYPMAPPKVRFLTRLYHPNIDRLGRICLDVIKKMWSPALQIRTVLLSIQALLAAPNPEDPLNNEAADLWKRDEESALAKAREWTRLYASDASAS